MKVSDPPPISPDEHVPLLLEAGSLCPLQHLPLVQDLQGEDAVRVLQLDHAHLAEGPATDHLEDLEVVLAQAERFDSVGHGFHCKWRERENVNGGEREINLCISLLQRVVLWQGLMTQEIIIL